MSIYGEVCSVFEACLIIVPPYSNSSHSYVCQEFEKEALRRKEVVEKLIESSSDGDAELMQLTDAWELVRRLDVDRSARLQQALQLVSDILFYTNVIVSILKT